MLFLQSSTFFSAAACATPQNGDSLKDGQDKDSRLGIYDGTVTTIEKHPYLVREKSLRF